MTTIPKNKQPKPLSYCLKFASQTNAKKITNTNQKRLLMTPLRNNTGPVNDMRIPLLNFVQKPNGVIKIQLWSILVFDLPKNALLSLSRMWYSFVFVISRFPKCKLVNTPPSKIITIIHVAIKIFVSRSDMEIHMKIKKPYDLSF